DRTGTMWIDYYDGGKQIVTNRLYKVDIATVTCTDTGKDLTHPMGPFLAAGLAVLPAPTDPTEGVPPVSAQYGMGASTVSEIGTVDLSGLTVTSIGPTFATDKITGTGDGRLFAFGALQVLELDPKTAASKSTLNVTGLPFQSYPGN